MDSPRVDRENLGVVSPPASISLADLMAHPEQVSRPVRAALVTVLTQSLVTPAPSGPLPPVALTPPPASTADEEVYTVNDVATRYHLNRAYVYELVRLRKLPAVRVGKFIRILARDLRQWEDTLAVQSALNGHKGSR